MQLCRMLDQIRERGRRLNLQRQEVPPIAGGAGIWQLAGVSAKSRLLAAQVPLADNDLVDQGALPFLKMIFSARNWAFDAEQEADFERKVLAMLPILYRKTYRIDIVRLLSGRSP